MNRADRMYAALMDGKPRTRQEIQMKVGYFLTNNAASELRQRGHGVTHWKEGRTHYYQLTPLSQSDGADNRASTSAGDAKEFLRSHGAVVGLRERGGVAPPPASPAPLIIAGSGIEPEENSGQGAVQSYPLGTPLPVAMRSST